MSRNSLTHEPINFGSAFYLQMAFSYFNTKKDVNGRRFHKYRTMDTALKKIQISNNYIPLRYDFYKGVRRMKLLTSRQIRQVRDVCIFRINGMEVFL